MPSRFSHRNRRPKSAGLPEAFVSYEPHGKWKLNCFPDKDCLMDVLGHNGKKMLEWTPDDRMIDSDGREYRLVNHPEKKCYDLEPTGETWSCEKLLGIAEDDARRFKRTPVSLRQQVDDAPPEKKMAVLMKCIDDRSVRWPASVWLAIVGFIVFLVLFFAAIMYFAGNLLVWLRK